MVDISVIIPVYNGAKWIDNCMNSIISQSIINTQTKIEIVVFNDGSTDETQTYLKRWSNLFKLNGVPFILNGTSRSKGVGAAKNSAVELSSGTYLCFQDIDDVMHPDRLLLQYNIAKNSNNLLVGSKIKRTPPNSTPRLVRWANGLTAAQLKLQIYTSNGPTLLMPTWFCNRSVFDKVGGFNERGHGVPEDLLFFYNHIDLNGDLYRVDEELVTYTYHEDAATFSIKREIIWEIQLNRIEKCVLAHWKNFTVWNAGRWGRRFVRSLSEINLKKILGFCDVDAKKIGCNVELYDPDKRKVVAKLPVVHFKDAIPPFVICVKLDLTKGEFEENLKSLNLIEGIDYILFS